MLLLEKNWHKHNVGMQFGALGLYFIGELFRWTQQHILSIIESVDSDERDSPLTQYVTNAGISRARYTIMHFKHHHRVLRLISNRMSV